jgi:hypothetical protein
MLLHDDFRETWVPYRHPKPSDIGRLLEVIAKGNTDMYAREKVECTGARRLDVARILQHLPHEPILSVVRP